jgi:hypothetical protein
VDAIACDAQATQPCADVTNKLGSMDLKTAWQQALAGTSDEAPCSTSMAAPASETQTGIQSGVQELLCLCPEGTSAEYVAYAVTQLHQGDVQVSQQGARQPCAACHSRPHQRSQLTRTGVNLSSERSGPLVTLHA